MKSKLYFLSFITASILFFSCKTAKKMYQKGNYDEAVELAAKKLQKNPNDAATLDILRDAYRFAVEDHETRISNNSNSNSDLRWEWNYREYVDLQRLYDAVRRSPGVFNKVRPTDYSTYVTSFREEAGNARFDRGLALMENNTKDGYKQAYFEFQKALDFKPGDLSATQKMEEAYAGAVTNVIVMPAALSGYQYSSYNSNYNDFNYNVLKYLGSNNSNSFMRYYSPADAKSANIRTDRVVELRFNNIDIDQYRDQRDTREVTKQVVVKETVVKADSVVREYATVKAKITTTRRVLQSNGVVQVTVRDHTNRSLWNDTYRGDYNWTYDFSTYTGDSRALSDEDKKLIERQEEFPPSNKEIMQIMMSEIQNKASCGIRDYFNRY